MEQNISCIPTMKGEISGKNVLEILAAKFKFKLKFVSSTLLFLKENYFIWGNYIKYLE